MSSFCWRLEMLGLAADSAGITRTSLSLAPLYAAWLLRGVLDDVVGLTLGGIS